MLEDSPNFEAYSLASSYSKLSHSQALHEYGLIQFEKQNFELAYEYLSEAGLEASKKICVGMIVRGQVKKKINLVVGSDRNQNLRPSFGKLLNNVFGPDVDTSHSKSFGGEAVTIDVDPSRIKGAKHIVGDASVYDFASKYDIKHVLIERLPTVINGVSQSKFTCACIENISKAMKTGSILEIELDPHVEQLIPSQYVQVNFSVNPFQGYIHFDTHMESTNVIAYEESPKFPEEYEPEDLEFMKQVADSYQPDELRDFYIRTTREAIQFYEAFDGKSPQNDPFRLRMQVETRIVLKALTEDLKIFFGYQVLHHSTEEFFHHANNIQFVPKSTPNGFYDNKQFGNNKKMTGYVYSPAGFSQFTHLKTVLNSVAVEHNKPYVARYLQSVGFGDVTVERRTNEHNGRQNVWMVRAVKV